MLVDLKKLKKLSFEIGRQDEIAINKKETL
jgi:hypothetical protein